MATKLCLPVELHFIKDSLSSEASREVAAEAAEKEGTEGLRRQ